MNQVFRSKVTLDLFEIQFWAIIYLLLTQSCADFYIILLVAKECTVTLHQVSTLKSRSRSKQTRVKSLSRPFLVLLVLQPHIPGNACWIWNVLRSKTKFLSQWLRSSKLLYNILFICRTFIKQGALRWLPSQ